MPPRGTTAVVIEVDSYDRAAGTTGALTVLQARDIESAVFQLPTATTVRVEGLAEIYEYMLKNGKWAMPDAQLVLRTDISAAGVPEADSAYQLLGRPEEIGIKRTVKMAISAGMSISWEFHQDSCQFALPVSDVIMSTHNLKHAEGIAPVIVGF